MKIDVYGDKISYVTNNISSVEAYEANLNEENRIKFATDLAAVSRGKSESANPTVRYKALLAEAAHNELANEKLPSRPNEFIPVVLGYHTLDEGIIRITKTNGDAIYPNNVHLEVYLSEFINSLGQHSHLKNGIIYTNMRAVITFGIPYDYVPYNTKDELSEFVAIKAMIPMFVWAQIPNTHTMISKEAQSDSVVENNEYWLPGDFRERVYKDSKSTQPSTHRKICLDILSYSNRDDIVKYLLNNLSQSKVQELFKYLGYPKEIYSRAMYYFKYKEVVVTTWKNELKAEFNKNCTQAETEVFVNCIKEIIESTTGYNDEWSLLDRHTARIRSLNI